MTKIREVYRCNVCGNIVEVLHAGAQMSCCGTPMALLRENTTDGATEKHVPVIERFDDGWKVTVGSTEHPMTEEQYIQWIELLTEHKVFRVELAPDCKPVAVFKTCERPVSAREYCNLHGLWRTDNKMEV